MDLLVDDRPDDWRALIEQIEAQADGVLGHWLEAARRSLDVGRIEEARAVLNAAVSRFSANPAPLHDLARLEEAQRNWLPAAQALRAYIDVRSDPSELWAYAALANSLREQGLEAEADAALAALLVYPDQKAEAFVEYARLAERRGDWDQAYQRYRLCNEKFPDHAETIVGMAHSLGRQGMAAQADDILTRAIERFPSAIGLRIGWVRAPTMAGATGDWEFLARARLLYADFPDDTEVARNFIEALQCQHCYAELETLLLGCIVRFPSDGRFAHYLATALARQEKWDAAFRVFASCVAKHPPDAWTLTDYAAALIATKRWDEAKEVVELASCQFPGNLSFGIASLDIMIGQGDVTEAVNLWRSLDAQPAPPESLRSMLFERRNLLLGMGIIPLAPASPPSAASSRAAGEDIAVKDIVTCFESLGGFGQGCEFGLFQRHFNVEPLGLLRWSEVEPQQLQLALQSDLEGIGSSEQTLLHTPGRGNHLEYAASDRRYGLQMHTFVRPDQVPPDKMFVQICRRMSFLRNKLLDDLRSGEKIFVYKNAHRDLTDREIWGLHEAVRRYGDSTLFCLRRADPTRAFPLVEAPAPGLLVGYIDHFAFDQDGTSRSIPIGSWSALTSMAYRIWRGSRGIVQQ